MYVCVSRTFDGPCPKRRHAQLSKSAEIFLKKFSEEKPIDDIRKMLQTPETKSVKDQLDQKVVSLLLAGAVLKKHCNNAAPRKRHVRFTDDLDALICEVRVSLLNASVGFGP